MWKGFDRVGKNLHRRVVDGHILLGFLSSAKGWELLWIGPYGCALNFDSEAEAWDHLCTHGLLAPTNDSVIRSPDINTPRRQNMSDLVMRKQEPKTRTNAGAKYDYGKIVHDIQQDGTGDVFLIVEDSGDFNTLYTALAKRGLKVITEATSKPGESPSRKNVYARLMTPAEEKAAAQRADRRSARLTGKANGSQADAEVATLEDAVSEAAKTFEEPAS